MIQYYATSKIDPVLYIHTSPTQSSLLLQRLEGPQEVAGALVAPGVLAEVELVVVLGVPPGAGGDDLGDDLALVPLLVGLPRHLFGDPLLLLVVEVDAAAVVVARVRPLPVQRRRVVHPVEELEELAVRDAAWVVVDLQSLVV